MFTACQLRINRQRLGRTPRERVVEGAFVPRLFLGHSRRPSHIEAKRFPPCAPYRRCHDS